MTPDTLAVNLPDVAAPELDFLPRLPASVHARRAAWRRFLRLLIVLTLATCGPGQAWAARLDEFEHSRWSEANGAPANILAIAQSKDGLLLLGTSSGLYRFDGRTFELVPRIAGDVTRSMQVSALLAGRDGEVWIGYESGGLAVYRRGVVQPFDLGPVNGRIARIVQSGDGAVWVLAQPYRRFLQGSTGPVWIVGREFRVPGVWRIARGRIEAITAEDGLAGVPWSDLLSTSSGVMVLGSDSVSTARKGSKSFVTQKVDATTGAAIAEDRAGRSWVIDGRGVRRLGRRGQGEGIPDVDGAGVGDRAILLDHAGGLWWTSARGRLGYVAKPNSKMGKARNRDDAEDAVGGHIRSLFEDRQGNVWVGTTQGLDRFRRKALPGFVLLSAESGAGWSLMAKDGGGIYAARRNGVYEYDERGRRLRLGGILSYNPPALCRSRLGGGTLVAGTRAYELPKLVARGPAVSGWIAEPEMLGCAYDAGGTLWVSVFRLGLFRLTISGWQHVPIFRGRPNVWPTSMAVDPSGDVLLNYASRALVRLHVGKVDRVWSSPLPIGTIRMMQPEDGGMLLGGDLGLALMIGDRFKVLDAARYPWLRAVAGAARTPDGFTWLLSASGLARVRTADLQAAFSGRAGDLRSRLFGVADGLPGAATPEGSANALAHQGGHLWLVTTEGLSRLDPRMLAKASPSSVTIRSLVANGVVSRDPSDLTLPAGTDQVEIRFASSDVGSPDRADIRYRLRGIENWVAAGDRRETFYSMLGPGHFRFEVGAVDPETGRLGPVGSVEFAIRPTLAQTTAFRVAVAATAFACLWLLYRRRLRHVAAQARMRTEGRLQERVRIARDLHDTLLQSVQGWVLGLHGVATRLEPGAREREVLLQMLSRADVVVEEARRSVLDLRSQGDAGDVAERLLAIARRLLSDEGLEIEITSEGRPRRLEADALDEIARIGAEAFRNVAVHARATCLKIEVSYAWGKVRIRIEDNGVGMPPDVARQGRDGHFGLIGMRERAARLGGSLRMDSVPAQGTRILLTVPVRWSRRRATMST